MGAAMLVPRNVFIDVGRWDEEFFFGGEDLDLCDRIGKRHAIIYHPGVAITHVGRVSTRLAIGPATTQILVGFARYLRKAGYSRRDRFLYKLVMTIDAPLQALEKTLQACWRLLKGERAQRGQKPPLRSRLDTLPLPRLDSVLEGVGWVERERYVDARMVLCQCQAVSTMPSQAGVLVSEWSNASGERSPRQSRWERAVSRSCAKIKSVSRYLRNIKPAPDDGCANHHAVGF